MYWYHIRKPFLFISSERKIIVFWWVLVFAKINGNHGINSIWGGGNHPHPKRNQISSALALLLDGSCVLYVSKSEVVVRPPTHLRVVGSPCLQFPIHCIYIQELCTWNICVQLCYGGRWIKKVNLVVLRRFIVALLWVMSVMRWVSESNVFARKKNIMLVVIPTCVPDIIKMPWVDLAGALCPRIKWAGNIFPHYCPTSVHYFCGGSWFASVWLRNAKHIALALIRTRNWEPTFFCTIQNKQEQRERIVNTGVRNVKGMEEMSAPDIILWSFNIFRPQ